ncbi:hypothetical protein CEN46_17990 [Fischerella thermalis CCMEE 5318]|uniref:Uncharacterized protein n=1 Tax=Fischerella thermalis CCMEE 5318 TaxID=2019666 RepID=A0A2N6LAY1_9CYAN|nr:hypothetical protein CEN46_17990 [Fischerella thermalis CCMEE 5318]
MLRLYLTIAEVDLLTLGIVILVVGCWLLVVGCWLLVANDLLLPISPPPLIPTPLHPSSS